MSDTTSTTADVGPAIRAALADHGHLAMSVDALADDSDLYEAGLTSHASVNLMLAVEDSFDVEFPEELLQRRTFASIAALSHAVSSLLAT